jgi:hypothetical protein
LENSKGAFDVFPCSLLPSSVAPFRLCQR